MSFAISVDLAGLKKTLDAKAAQVQAASRPAAQAGAQVIYERAKINCPVSVDAHYFYGKQSKKTGVRYLFKPGNLRDSIYQAFNETKSGGGISSYSISWNHTKAPYGHMVEFGTSRAPAHAFLGPAMASHGGLALEAMRRRFAEEMKK